MRQFFTFRFWLSVVAVLGLLAFLAVQVRDTDVGKSAQADGPTDRNINLITRVLGARLDQGWTVRDGKTVGSAEIDTGYGATLSIKEGTLEPARLERWRQLQAENRDRTPVYSGPKGNKTLRKKKY